MKPSPSFKRESLADVTVDALGGMGDGLSSLKEKPLFIEKAAPGDRLSIRIVRETGEALRGEIVEILEGGPDRVAPPCPHFSACGGCSLQQLRTDSYQAFKRRMLASALAHGGFPDTAADVIFLPAASRRRVELKARVGTDGLSFAYYAPRSRDLVPIENCLILEPALQALMTPLAKALGAWAGASTIKTVRLTAADSGIDMTLDCLSETDDTGALGAMADALGIARISLIIPGRQARIVVNRAPVTMHLGGHDVALPQNAFLQASREGQRLLTDAVLAGVADTSAVADLFCGIGTYSFALSKTAKVHAVETDAAMVQHLKSAVKQVAGTAITAERRDLFKSPLTAAELRRFDAVVLNPPRPGAKTQTGEIAASTVPRVVMVSCSTASFARDAKALKAAGFTIEKAFGVDQFVYSPHLEIVAVFKR